MVPWVQMTEVGCDQDFRKGVIMDSYRKAYDATREQSWDDIDNDSWALPIVFAIFGFVILSMLIEYRSPVILVPCMLFGVPLTIFGVVVYAPTKKRVAIYALLSVSTVYFVVSLVVFIVNIVQGVDSGLSLSDIRLLHVF